jgi:UDP-N-acetylglucosamine transferase subunit ALG13
VVVAHAGMGTILTCLELGKPILIFPRQAALGEQRNDHQLATAERFRERGDVHVAMEEDELAALLDRVDNLKAAARLGSRASDELLTAIRAFIGEGRTPTS